MSLERLWAGWRAAYVTDPSTGTDLGECLFCGLVRAADDAAALVLERTPSTITVMNLFPYTSGHLMVAPRRHVADYEDLDDGELTDLARAQQRAIRAVKAAYEPEGLNAGLNLGRAAGAGVPGHLHVHVVPRWTGDTNFMTALAGVRVMPEDLPSSYARLQAAWPG